MAGLLRRAVSIRAQNQLSASHDDDHGISSEERARIAEQIENLLKTSGPSIEHDPTPYTPRKRGIALPALVNAAAAVIIVTTAYLVPLFFVDTETDPSARGETIDGAEGMVVGAVQDEAQARIAEREEQISRIQHELAEADRRREELAANMEQELAEREAELRRTIESDLEAERARLAEEGLSAGAIERELEDIERERQDELAVELEAQREEAEAELRTRKEELERSLTEAEDERRALMAELEDEFEGERQQAQARFAALQQRRQEYELASSQITASYEEIAQLIGRGDFSGALDRLDGLAEYLDRAAFEEIPRLSERRNAELLTVEAMKVLLREQLEANEAQPGRLALERRLEERKEEIESLRDEIQRQNEQLAAREGELTEQASELEQQESARAEAQASADGMSEELQQTEARLQELVESRAALTQAFDRMVSGIAPAAEAEHRSADEVVSKLSAKLQVRQVLQSDAVRAEHPELYERFQEYLDAYSAQETARGRAAALSDIAQLAESIRSDSAGLTTIDSVWAGYTSAEEQQQMIRLFRTMQRLVSR